MDHRKTVKARHMATGMTSRVILPLLILLVCLPSPAATIHVPGDFATIKAGILAAQDGDTVLVAEGTYGGPGNINLLISGKSITLQSEAGPQATIIDCQELGRWLAIGPVSNGAVTIEGFTITNGRSAPVTPADRGGAIYITQAVVIIQDCLILDNEVRTTNSHGGAIIAENNSDLAVLNCTLTNNRSRGYNYKACGGAIACIDSTLTIDNCILSENRASGSGETYGYGDGGAVYIYNATAQITGSEISHNSCWACAQDYTGDDAGASGGGVYGTESILTMERCLITGNRVSAMAEYWAGVWGAGVCTRWPCSLTLRDCQFTDNYLDDVGWDESGRGGGVYSSTCLIENCLFVGNNAEQVCLPYSPLTMEGCTIASGKPLYYGGSYAGGVCCEEGTIRNTIIWDNPSPQLRIYQTDTVEYCDIEDGWPGTGNLSANPLFTPGPLGGHYLSQIAAGQLFNSPCLDAGDPASPIVDGTTRTDSVQDENLLDMGYHYPLLDGLYICNNPWSLSFLARHGGSSPDDQIIEISPCIGGTLEWQVESDATWLSLSPLSGVSTGEPDPVIVSVDTTGFPPGMYEATITIQANGALNTPLQISVGLAVGEIVIDYSPESLYFAEVIGVEPAEDQILEIWNDDLFTLEWAVSSDAPWLSLDPQSGQSAGEHDQVNVHVDPSGLSLGFHTATITISDPKAVNSPQTVDVTFMILEMIIGYLPGSFTFLCDFAGTPPPEQQLEVWNAGYSGMIWSVDDDADWLTLEPEGGMSTGEHDVIQLIVDQQGLQPGTHVATVTISADRASNSPQLVPVILTVVDPDALPRLVVGPGPKPDNPSLIRIYPPEQDAAVTNEFSAYATPGYGANVSCANIDSDYFDEILTGPGPGDILAPHVRGFEIHGTPLPGLSFIAYGTNKYGVNVAAGDLDGDGFDEIITGAGPGAVFGPHVRAFDYDGSPGVNPVPGISFFAYGTPKWGVNVAAGDIDGDGFDEIITGAGPGAVYGPHVRGWNVDCGTAAAIPGVSFLAYGTNKFGVNVTAGDVDGDGIDEIVTGAGPGAVFGPHVRGWNYDGSTVTPLPGFSFFAWQTPPLRYGVNVFAGADLNGDGRDELVAGRGPDPDADTEVKVFTYDGTTVSHWISLEAYPGLLQGTNVAAGRF